MPSLPEEKVIDALTDQVYVDWEHIYPCFDLGLDDLLGDGRVLITGNRAGYPPTKFGKNWTGCDGPFVLIVGEKLLDKFKAKPGDGANRRRLWIAVLRHQNFSTAIHARSRRRRSSFSR